MVVQIQAPKVGGIFQARKIANSQVLGSGRVPVRTYTP